MSHLRVVAVEQIEVMNSRGQAYGEAKALHVPFLQTVRAHCVIFKEMQWYGMGKRMLMHVFSEIKSL